MVNDVVHHVVHETTDFVFLSKNIFHGSSSNQIVDHAVYDLVNHMVDHVVHEWSTILLDFVVDYIVDRVVHHVVHHTVQFY